MTLPYGTKDWHFYIFSTDRLFLVDPFFEKNSFLIGLII